MQYPLYQIIDATLREHVVMVQDEDRAIRIVTEQNKKTGHTYCIYQCICAYKKFLKYTIPNED